ncbi:MAG: hypothetical protein J7K40_03680 [candidate division Zixibacteria bacterium]|nr:hypothetical protein [candidate division Zixibacteria bacterium]
MIRNTKRRSNKNDTIIMVVALFVMLLAGGISMSTINTDQNVKSMQVAAIEPLNPLNLAEQAAMAGIKAAKGHIECHSIKKPGSLPRQFYVNGGRFEVEWDDINIADSTVNIVSTGYYESDSKKTYTSRLESVIDLSFMPSHNQQILSDYYMSHPKNHAIKQTGN